MNTTKNKIDVSLPLYVVIMIVVFLLGSCSTPKRVVPVPKYQKSTCCKSNTTSCNGLKITEYKSV